MAQTVLVAHAVQRAKIKLLVLQRRQHQREAQLPQPSPLLPGFDNQPLTSQASALAWLGAAEKAHDEIDRVHEVDLKLP